MNTKTIGAIALTGALAIVGCVSVENTRTQLSSGNPQEVQKAEENIFRIATTGKDVTGFIQYDNSQQIEYLNLVKNNELLFKIINNTSYEKIRKVAAGKLDFSEKGVGMKVLKEYSGLIDIDDGKGGHPIKEKVFASLSEKELLQIVGLDEVTTPIDRRQRNVPGKNPSNLFSSKIREEAAKRLVETSSNPDVLYAFFEGDFKYYGHADLAGKKILQNIDKIHSEQLALAMLNTCGNGFTRIVQDGDMRKKLISILSDTKKNEIALAGIKGCSYGDWRYDKVMPLKDSIEIAKSFSDKEQSDKIVLALLEKIAEFRNDGKDSSEALCWRGCDEKNVRELAQMFPKLTGETLVKAIQMDEKTGLYLLENITADDAYTILCLGKLKSAELEMALLKLIPNNKIDMNIYNGVRFSSVKKVVVDAMSPEMKKSAVAAAERASKDVCEKAKAAAKETFALDGFYLGMSFDDMKIIFTQHFPGFEIKEAIDGEGNDADYVIYVTGQRSPFCYASVKDKKVWQFNFGKKLLKKWYQYDVQTPMEWAHTYGRENKIDMKFKLIEKDTTVYEPSGSDSYRVWFHQESYQYKHNAKEYRLTYFGEEKDFTFEGGLGGQIIKELAAPRFRYVRGDPWSLRATIERD